MNLNSRIHILVYLYAFTIRHVNAICERLVVTSQVHENNHKSEVNHVQTIISHRINQSEKEANVRTRSGACMYIRARARTSVKRTLSIVTHSTSESIDPPPTSGFKTNTRKRSLARNATEMARLNTH